MKTLRAYIITRILFTIPMLFILVTLVFFVVRIMPGDPVEAMMRPGVPKEYKEQIKHNLGLDLPLFINLRGSSARLQEDELYLRTAPSEEAVRSMRIDGDLVLDISDRDGENGDWLRVVAPKDFESWVSPEQMDWMRQVNTEMSVLEERVLPGTETWTTLNSPDGPAGNQTNTIWELSSGVMWFGSDQGVTRYSTNGWDSFEETTGQTITTIWADKPSEIWFGTDGNGLLLFRGNKWSTLSTDDELPGSHVYTIWGQGSRTMWVGTDQGAGLYNGRRWTTFTTADGLAGDTVRAIWGSDKKNVWLGTDSGLNHYDGETWTTFGTADGLPDAQILALVGNEAGIWAGTANGLAHFDGEIWHSVAIDALPSPIVQTLWLDEDGTLGAGTPAGLGFYDGETWTTYTTGLADPDVGTMWRDKEGTLWVGTAGGLVQYDSRPWIKLHFYEGGIEGWAPASAFQIKLNPLDSQYFNYLWDLLHFDLGESLAPTRGRPVITDLKAKFPATLELAIAALLITILIGVPTGAFAAYKRRSAADYGFRIFSIVIWAVPVFWLGIMFQLVFGVYLAEWYESSSFAQNVLQPVLGNFLPLPISGRIGTEMAPKTVTGMYVIDSILTGNWTALKDSLRYLLLPAMTLGLYLSGVFTRLTRSNMLDVLKADFITAARARGIKERTVVYTHALKNAFIPVLTMMGLQFASLLAGAVLTETTFSWPGMGLFMWERIGYRDFNSIQGSVVFFALLVSAVSLLVDIIYAWIDPRIRY